MNHPAAHSAPIHRAWIICGACFMMLFIGMGINANVFSIYTSHIISECGFTNTQTSLVNTIRCLFTLIGTLTVQRVCSALGLRWTIALAFGLQVVSRLVFAVTSTFPAYCLGALLGGLAYAWSGMVPLSILVNRWFRTQAGAAVGIGSAGSGAATILLPPVFDYLIRTHGLHFTFLVEACLTALLSLLVILLIRESPADVGLEPYSSQHHGKESPHRREVPAGFDRRLWCWLMFAMVLMGGPLSPAVTHLPILLTSSGYSSDVTSYLVSIFGMVLIFSKIFYGSITDHIGGWRSNLTFGTLFAVSHALLAVICSYQPLPSFTTAAMVVMLYSLALPVSTVGVSIWARDLSGDDTYDRTIRWCNVMCSLGSLLFSAMPGFIADHIGSYTPAYFIFALVCFYSLGIVQYIYRKLGLNKR